MTPDSQSPAPFVLLRLSHRFHSTGADINYQHHGAIVRTKRLLNWLLFPSDGWPSHPCPILSGRWAQTLRELDQASQLPPRSMGSLSLFHLPPHANDPSMPYFHATFDSFIHATPAPTIGKFFESNDRLLFELIDPLAFHLPRADAELGTTDLIGRVSQLTQIFESRLAMEQDIPAPKNSNAIRRL